MVFAHFRRLGQPGRLALGLMTSLMLAGTKTHADERAQALLQRVQDTLHQTLTAQFTTQSLYHSRYRDTQEKGVVRLAVRVMTPFASRSMIGRKAAMSPVRFTMSVRLPHNM